MNLEGRRSNSRTRRLSSSSLISEEDKSNSGIIESLDTDVLQPPPTAVIRRAETRCIKTNQTTGLKIAEQCTKNLSIMSSVRQLITQKECIKLGSGRPIISRGQRDKNFHGFRHFQGLLHSKIRDLALEIENLHRSCNDAQQEYINSITYEAKAKELASELINFQKTLTELNLAFDYVNRIGVEELQQDVRQLEELNISERRRIEGIFNERKLKEDLVRQIGNDERVKEIINSSHPNAIEGKEQHIYFNKRLSQSLKAVEFWEKQIEKYNQVKDMLIQELNTKLPFMDDVILLEIELLNLKRKWIKMNENSTLKSNKGQEVILENVKLDKSEITRMEFDLKSLNKQIGNLQEVIDYLKSSEGEIHHKKETIDIYLSSFDDMRDNEIRKLNFLKSEAINYLSDLEIKLSSIPTTTDYYNLQENKKGEIEISDSISFQELFKASNYLKKLELMKFQQTKECHCIDEKCHKLKNDLEEYKSQNKLNHKFQNQENKFINQILQLEEDKAIHLKEQEVAKAKLLKLEKEISENEKHNQLVALEETHLSLEEDISLMNQTLNEMKTTTTNLLEIRAKTLSLMGFINSRLTNNYDVGDVLNH